MKTNLKNFNIKLNEEIPVDKFIEKALYAPKVGYYPAEYLLVKKEISLPLQQFQIYFLR